MISDSIVRAEGVSLDGARFAGIRIRPASPADAEALCEAYRRNRAHLRPWEPRRGDAFFTPEGQAARLRDQAEQRSAGRLMPWVLVDGGGKGAPDGHGGGNGGGSGGGSGARVVGIVTLSNITLGPWCSATLGYWIDADHVGRGLATAVVELACRAALEEFGLHRVEAGAAVDNTASQRVLVKSGFDLIGTARRYLHIDGAWRDHRIFQRILHDDLPAH